MCLFIWFRCSCSRGGNQFSNKIQSFIRVRFRITDNDDPPNCTLRLFILFLKMSWNKKKQKQRRKNTHQKSIFFFSFQSIDFVLCKLEKEKESEIFERL